MATAEQACELLSRSGKLHPQPACDWSGHFPIPLALEQFYRDVGPVDVSIKGFSNPFFLPSLAKLWDFQAGYRWDATSGKPIAGWQEDWLVVAVEGSDPFILSRSTGVVLHDFCGHGEWAPVEMFPDLVTMAACLGQIGAIVSQAGEKYCDDDCIIRPEWREATVTALAPLLGSPSLATSVLESLDWA